MKTKKLEQFILAIAVLLSTATLIGWFTGALPSGLQRNINYILAGAIALYVGYVYIVQSRDHRTIDGLEQRIDDLKHKVADRESTITKQKGSIKKLEGQVSELQSEVNSLNEAFEKAKKEWTKEKAELESKFQS